MLIIIAGFATCGKSVLRKKYKNVIDLESSLYKYKIHNDGLTAEQRKATKREANNNWPQNYYDAIEQACKKYDVVLVKLSPEIFDYFDARNIKYSVVYPNLNNWNEVEKRCKERGNNEAFIKRLKEVFVTYYQDVEKRNYENLFILNGSETLEDCLIKNKIRLIKKEK